MNENKNEPTEPTAKESLCWTCRHGLCIRDVELHSHYEKIEQEPKNAFLEIEKEDGSEEIAEMIIPETKIRTVCFWRPDYSITSPPIMLSRIDECNRYDKKQ